MLTALARHSRAVLLRLGENGRAVCEGGMRRLSDHRPRLAGADEKLWRRVRPLLADWPIAPAAGARNRRRTGP
jgi:hypothetical protein